MNNLNNLKQNILAKIKTGDLVMKPRWQFILQSSLLIVGIAITALTIIYLFSFVWFILNFSGAIYGPSLGVHGLIAFLLSVPWTIFILGLVFMVLLENLVQRFAFAYHKPLLYSVLGVMLFSAVGSYVVLETTVHDRLKIIRTPIISTFYRSYSEELPYNLYIGQVTALTSGGILLNDKRRGVIFITTNNYPSQVGDTVIIFGQPNAEGKIVAREIRLVISEVPQR